MLINSNGNMQEKKEIVWLFKCTPVHLCTGGSSKEGSKSNHRIKNKPTNQQLTGFRSSIFPFSSTEVERCHVYIKIPTYEQIHTAYADIYTQMLKRSGGLMRNNGELGRFNLEIRSSAVVKLVVKL